MASFLSLTHLRHCIVLLAVISLHAVILFSAIRYQPLAKQDEPLAVRVTLISALQRETHVVSEPLVPPSPKPKPKPKPKKIKQPKKVQVKPQPLPVPLPEQALDVPFAPVADDLQLETSSGNDPVKPTNTSEPAVYGVPESKALEPMPPSIALSTELSLVCKHRTLPNYPEKSIQLGEQGRVVLYVTLDAYGNITNITIKESSGHTRLDQAGIEAIQGWRCNAAKRNGQYTPSTALQPFDFILD